MSAKKGGRLERSRRSAPASGGAGSRVPASGGGSGRGCGRRRARRSDRPPSGAARRPPRARQNAGGGGHRRARARRRSPRRASRRRGRPAGRRLAAVGRPHRERGDAFRALDGEPHPAIIRARPPCAAARAARARRRPARRPVARPGESGRALADARGETPSAAPPRPPGAHSAARFPFTPLGRGREEVGAVAPDLPLVDDTREPAVPGSTPRRGTSGSDTAAAPSSTSRISSQASASS